MIVVSDASPLNYLVLINAVQLLPQLFNEVFVPPKVMEELGRPRTPEKVKLWAQSPAQWLRIRAPQAEFAFSARLGPGEAHALSLAKELRADAVLIDEKHGRRVARQEGLHAIGTITVLQLASRNGFIELKPALEALQQTTFRISPALIRAVLDDDADRKQK